MGILRWLLAPLSPLYGGVVHLRNRGFDGHPERVARVEVPVISLGNLSTGGTGKTPLTLHLAEQLQAREWFNTIISRGYRGRRPIDPMRVEPDGNPLESGDEPMMMARRLGPGRVVVSRRRHAGALLALSGPNPPKVLLLDDGFQHRALHRDLDLLLLDGVQRWGNGRMLPLGNLREPMSSAARAQALVVTRGSRCDRAQVEAWWARYGSGGPIFFVDFAIGALRHFVTGERRVLPGGSPGPLVAFCGLGHPEAFYADLLVAGQPWQSTFSLGDHRSLSPQGLGRLCQQANNLDAMGLVCTEKDAVKLTPAHTTALTLPLWVAEQEVRGAEELLAFVLQRLRKD